MILDLGWRVLIGSLMESFDLCGVNGLRWDEEAENPPVIPSGVVGYPGADMRWMAFGTEVGGGHWNHSESQYLGYCFMWYVAYLRNRSFIPCWLS